MTTFAVNFSRYRLMRNPDRETIFRFKQFEVANRLSAMKVGTDGVLLGAWCLSDTGYRQTNTTPDRPTPKKILDAGCGTGLIALMMAQRFPDAEITAIEIDSLAAREAKNNFSKSPWSGRLSLIEGDFNSAFRENETDKFDLIVSNPPFFNNGELSPDKLRVMARHESSLTLETLTRTSRRILSKNGSLCMILPADREEELKFMAVANHFDIQRTTRVSTVPSKPPRRILAELRPSGLHLSDTHPDHLSIHDAAGGFTGEYTSLVKDFYLNF